MGVAESRGPIAADPLGETFPPLTTQEALVEANRCLYCYDAPCTKACPTHIDVPRFIKKIATVNLIGSAAAIYESNLLGATCARVCPVQELCEGACVLGAEHRPIKIGRLQRYAMDSAQGAAFPKVAESNGKPVAVIGSGPAGLSCAGELAKLGYAVTVYDKRHLPGGLSTYGIISLREPTDVALAEVEMIKGMGVQLVNDKELGKDLSLTDLQRKFGAIFLSVGLGATPKMAIEGEEHILDGSAYIEASKMGRAAMRVGRSVAVIGAGNTAIDCATVAKRLGAERVTMVYRRSEHEMTAYRHEYEFIKNEGVEFRFLAQPVRVVADGALVRGLQCARVALGGQDASGRPAPEVIPDSEFVIEADQIVKAIGQERPSLVTLLGLESEMGYITVNDEYETSLLGVFAGGDCIRSYGATSTVMAVQDGKLAAAAIHRRLTEVKD